MVAVNWLPEVNVVVNGVPLNCTTEDAVNLVPVTVRTTSAPPAAAEPGLSDEMIGVVGPVATGAGGVGSGVAGGVAMEIGLTMLPATRNTCPSVVLNARPFSPQRIRRPAVPFTPVI